MTVSMNITCETPPQHDRDAYSLLVLQDEHTEVTEEPPKTLKQKLEEIMPEDGTHSQKVLVGVTEIVKMYEEGGKPKPSHYWIPFKRINARRSMTAEPEVTEVVAFDEAGMVAERPEDADGYPGCILLEARTNGVWDGRMWSYSLKAANELANLQAGLLFCLDLGITSQYDHVSWIEKALFIGGFSIAQVLGFCVAVRRVQFTSGKYLTPPDNANFCERWAIFKDFVVECFLDFVSCPSELRDAPQDFGPVKNHGMVGGYNQAGKVPLIALGVEAQYNFESDRSFLSRIPRVLLHDGLCFIVLLHLGTMTLLKHGVKALTFSWLFATALSIIQFFEESARAWEWMSNFKKCRIYREARASDALQRTVVRNAAKMKLEEMAYQCPIL